MLRWLTAITLVLLTAANPTAAEAGAVDHGDWHAFLGRHVYPDPDGINRIRYGEVPRADRMLLRNYINALARVAVAGLGPREQQAYWINLHNALVVELVLNRYPVRSIRDIDLPPGSGDGPWRRTLIRVEGRPISLDAIRNRILLPTWRDPRIHYTLSDATLGGPNLLPVAFTGDNLDDLKTEAARAYINHPRGVTVTGNRAAVSALYDRYGRDFGPRRAHLKTHLMLYASPELAARLAGIERFDHAYDWALNDGAAGR